MSEEGKMANNRVITLVDRALTVPKQGTSVARCPTNLDLTTMQGKALMLKASSPSDYECLPGKPLKMIAVAWAVIPDVQEDEETGELSEFVRTVFFDADGKTFRTSAAHMPMRLCAMLELFAPADWIQGVPLVITVRQSKRGRMYHDIQVDTSVRYGI